MSLSIPRNTPTDLVNYPKTEQQVQKNSNENERRESLSSLFPYSSSYSGSALDFSQPRDLKQINPSDKSDYSKEWIFLNACFIATWTYTFYGFFNQPINSCCELERDPHLPMAQNRYYEASSDEPSHSCFDLIQTSSYTREYFKDHTIAHYKNDYTGLDKLIIDSMIKEGLFLLVPMAYKAFSFLKVVLIDQTSDASVKKVTDFAIGLVNLIYLHYVGTASSYTENQLFLFAAASYMTFEFFLPRVVEGRMDSLKRYCKKIPAQISHLKKNLQPCIAKLISTITPQEKKSS